MADQLIKVFKALSDETRLEILRDFMGGHNSVCPEIKSQLSKSQPTLSHHIGKLVDAEVLIETKKGVTCYYKVNDKYLKKLGIDVKKFTGGRQNG